MTDANDGVDEFILKHAYDPAYAREYYLKNRKLKGKKPNRVEEDQVPMKSKTGAKLVDFSKGPHGMGQAVYSDGSSFDGNGWTTSKSKAQGKAKASAAERKNAAQRKLSQARVRANKIKSPRARKAMLNRIASAERKLSAIKVPRGV